ncbi:hypothetical protein J4429_01765 [Candidatus Pacearchaeota archaeon]|nr:hypothetical protein [Candidatus Pacearchaeota archaeon]
MKHKDIHSHEISEGVRIGEYRVIQHTRNNVIAEHIRTGELARFDYAGDNLVKTRHY